MQPGMGRPVLTKSKVTSHCYELEAILPDVRPHWIISQIAGRISKKSELTHCVVELIFCFVNLWVIEISFKGSINDVCLWKQICKNKSFERDSKSVSGFFCRHQKAMYEAAVIMLLGTPNHREELCKGSSCCSLISLAGFVPRPCAPQASLGQALSMAGIPRKTSSWETGSPLH